MMNEKMDVNNNVGIKDADVGSRTGFSLEEEDTATFIDLQSFMEENISDFSFQSHGPTNFSHDCYQSGNISPECNLEHDLTCLNQNPTVLISSPNPRLSTLHQDLDELNTKQGNRLLTGLLPDTEIKWEFSQWNTDHILNQDSVEKQEFLALTRDNALSNFNSNCDDASDRTREYFDGVHDHFGVESELSQFSTEQILNSLNQVFVDEPELGVSQCLNNFNKTECLQSDTDLDSSSFHEDIFNSVQLSSLNNPLTSTQHNIDPGGFAVDLNYQMTTSGEYISTVPNASPILKPLSSNVLNDEQLPGQTLNTNKSINLQTFPILNHDAINNEEPSLQSSDSPRLINLVQGDHLLDSNNLLMPSSNFNPAQSCHDVPNLPDDKSSHITDASNSTDIQIVTLSNSPIGQIQNSNCNKIIQSTSIANPQPVHILIIPHTSNVKKAQGLVGPHTSNAQSSPDLVSSTIGRVISSSVLLDVRSNEANTVGLIPETQTNQSDSSADHLSTVKLFICEFCGMKFKIPGNLKVHIRTHTGEKPFLCETCQKTFRTNSSLNEHRKTHAKQRDKFICTICQTVLTSAPGLQKHWLSHSGSKNFKCDFCPKAFSTASHLKRHVRIHTKEKPHKCDVCGETFIQKGNLKLHARQHEVVKPYSCHQCHQQFCHKSSLQNHLKKCNPDTEDSKKSQKLPLKDMSK